MKRDGLRRLAWVGVELCARGVASGALRLAQRAEGVAVECNFRTSEWYRVAKTMRFDRANNPVTTPLEDWLKFEALWPWTPVDLRTIARQRFLNLSPKDRAAAIAAARRYVACTPAARVAYADRWIMRRMWEFEPDGAKRRAK